MDRTRPDRPSRRSRALPALLAGLAGAALLAPAPAAARGGERATLDVATRPVLPLVQARSRHRGHRHRVRPPLPLPPFRVHRHRHYRPYRTYGWRYPYYYPYRSYYYGYYYPYYWDAGRWVTRVETKIVVPLAVGSVVSELPPFYDTIWVNETPYHHKDGTYYLWDAERDGYVVVARPGDPLPPRKTSPAEAAESAGLYVYPNADQSVDQQAKDRYECHEWAVEQTGFDPSTVPEGERESEQERSGYLRASKACLEARDYTVK